MNRGKEFDTIWRERFRPQQVPIPPEQYRDYEPQVDVIPVPVYDGAIIALDERFQTAISASFGVINGIVVKHPPEGIKVPMAELVRQLPGLLSGAERAIKVFAGYGRLIKLVPVTGHLRDECAKIQRLILERLLVFEDLEGVFNPEDVDQWADAQRVTSKTPQHYFRKGEKVRALLKLLEESRSEKVVVFVRNIPTCEGLCTLLLENGLRATFVHGEIPNERQQRLDQFKSGEARVLVVTRQLFGRGFDLPQADKAIFYSPKDSERTMWQEVLRIRGTVRKRKDVFVLFYALTAEESKLLRLLRRMIRTGARQMRDRYRWKYFEESPPTERTRAKGSDEEQRRGRGEPEVLDLAVATRTFIVNLIVRFGQIDAEKPDGIARFLNDISRQAGFNQVWPKKFVADFFAVLSDAILKLLARKNVSRKIVKNELAKVLHPDKHASAVGEEQRFWHELSVQLNIQGS